MKLIFNVAEEKLKLDSSTLFLAETWVGINKKKIHIGEDENYKPILLSFLDIEGKDLSVPYLLYLEEWGDFTIENDSVNTKEIDTLAESLPPHLMLDTILKVMSAATENAVKLIKETK